MPEDMQGKGEHDRKVPCRDDEQPEIEGHRLRQGAERMAFGTEDAAAAERRPAGIRPHGELDSDEPEVEGHRLASLSPENPERLRS